MALFRFAAMLLFLLLSVHLSSSNALSSSSKYCDFDCVHGKCDRQTRHCVCSPAWMGADCDLCPLGVRCPLEEPSLSLIIPQAAPIGEEAQLNRSEVAFVSALGRALPKGLLEGRYNCLFGSSTISKGRWVSSSLVRCPVPAQSLPGKYAFSIVPEGSNAQIPNGAGEGTSHFTFFVPCSSVQCLGFCLGPLCLCPQSQIGNFCEVITPMAENATIVKLKLSNDTAMTRAVEFKPYISKIPNWNELSRVTVQSDIDGLETNSLNGMLYWPSPLGRLRPYSIGLRVQSADGTNFVANWTLRVKPSYSAQLNKDQSFDENSNGRSITGKVIWKEPKASLNQSVPLLLRVSQSDNFIEEISLWTDSDGQKFRYVLFPYLGSSENIAITAVHPGVSDDAAQILDEAEAVEWTQKWAEVTQFDAELSVDDGQPFQQNYSLRMAPMGDNCSGQWHFEVVEPRQMFSIEKAIFEDDGQSVRLRFRPLAMLSAESDRRRASPLALKTAFICMPSGQSQIISQIVNGIGPKSSKEGADDVGLKMDPKILFVDVAQSDRSLAIFTLDLWLPSRHVELLQQVHLDSASFSPFGVVWLSRPRPNIWRLWLSLQSDQLGQEGNSDGAILIRGGENLALSVPYRIQRFSAAAKPPTDAFLFTLTVSDSFAVLSPSAHSADVELFTQQNGQQFVRSIPLNVPEQFGPLRADIFQLRIRSRNFSPYASLIKIDPLNNALIIDLQRMPNQYFAFDGQTVASEWEELDQTAFRPCVRLSPSTLSNTNPKTFVDFVYTNGPPNSFVWLSSDVRHSPSSSPFSGPEIDRAAMPLANATLCLGCGFRQPLHLRSFPSVPAHCGALSVAVPFTASLPSGGSLLFRQYLLITSTSQNDDDLSADNEKEVKPKGICHSTEEDGTEGTQDSFIVPQLAFRSPIFRSCSKSKLRRCLSLFRPPGPKCQHWWAQLPDNLLSVHSVAQFLLLSIDCRRENANLESMEQLIKCITSVDKQCPLHPSEAEMAPHRGAQLFNQMGHLKPFRAGLQSLFPALSLIESQLINLPSLLGEFLSQLKVVLPPPIFLPLSSSTIYDQFVAAISDNSSAGPIIEANELKSANTEELVDKWNRAVNLVSSKKEDEALDEDGTKALAEWRELVKSSDRIKSVARQFGAENPFSLFKDVLRQIFTNSDLDFEKGNAAAADYQMEETIGWADVRTDREEVGEDEEFRILVTVRLRERTSAVLTSVGTNIRFTPPIAPLRFRLGPIRNFGQPSELRAGDTFSTEWTVLPISEFRLTESIQLEPNLILSFELDGQRKAQLLNAPSVLIRPRPVLRLLAFSQPTLSASSSAHSLHISAINSGYSDLNSVELRELRPEIKWAESGASVDFRFSNVLVEGNDGQNLPEGSFLSFGTKIPSGNASHMTLNISVTSSRTNNAVALFSNFSAVVSVDGSLLPMGQFEQRFFLIQQCVRGGFSFLLVSEYLSPLPLYLYSKSNSELTPLATVQLVEEKELRSVTNGHHFLSRVFALRRFGLFPSPIGSIPPRHRFPSSASSALPIASVFATLRVNTSQTFADGAKLLRVYELSQNRQRQIDPKFIWIGEDSDEKTTTINFIDLDASASVPQLFYELLFGRPEHFRAPFFPQTVYKLQLNIPPSISPAGHQEVLARITATSPLGLPLNYSLRSPHSESPFSVVPSTADIVITHPLSPIPAEYCLNLMAIDQKGMRAQVPVQIFVGEGGGQQIEAEQQEEECKLYSAETTELFEHDFRKTQRQTVAQEETTLASSDSITEATTQQTAESAETQTAGHWQHSSPSSSARSIVIELGGDSTLSPITFSSEMEVTAAEEQDNQSTVDYQQEEITATSAVPSPLVPFSIGVASSAAGHSSPINSRQQFLTAYSHRAVFSTTKTPPLQLAGLGTSSQKMTGKKGKDPKDPEETARNEFELGPRAPKERGTEWSKLGNRVHRQWLKWHADFALQNRFGRLFVTWQKRSIGQRF